MGEFLHLIAKVQHWWCDIRRFFNKVTKPYAKLLFFSCSTENSFPKRPLEAIVSLLCSLVAFLEFSKTRNPPIIEFFSLLPNQKFICLTRSRRLHSVWKSQKVAFNIAIKSLRSNSVTRQVTLKDKIGGKCKKWKFRMGHFEQFSNTVDSSGIGGELKLETVTWVSQRCNGFLRFSEFEDPAWEFFFSRTRWKNVGKSMIFQITLLENYSKCRIRIFQFWHFSSIFILLKIDLSGISVWQQSSAFQNSR